MGYSNSPLVCYTGLSPNHSGQRTHSIDRITPHCVVGQLSCETICACFPQGKNASCNYGIGSDGRISLCVEEKNRAWTSSSNANDQRAVTIECASDKTEPYAMTDAVYQSLIKLCVDICKRNGKKKLLWFGDKNKTLNYAPASDEMVLTVHRWFANKSCPGNWLYSRLGDLAAKVTAQLGGTSQQTVNSFPSCPFTVQVIIDDLNIRTSAGMGDNLTGKVTGKGIFTITEVKDGWGKLKSGAGWIYLENPSYVTIESTIAPASEQKSAPDKIIEAQATTSADPEKVWNFLSAWIGNDYGVAGIMGNLHAESALVANNLQNTYEKKLGLNDAQYTAKVDDGSYTNFVKDSAGYGLAQWTYWTRKQALLEYANSKKSSIGNLDMQLEFLKKEMTGYGSLIATLKSAKSVTEASTAVLTIYEKPADQGEAVQAKRASYGQKYYDQFHKEQKSDVLYRVQVGAFSKKENAEACLKKVKAAGFTDAFIKE